MTLPSPDGRRTFEITESYVNGIYESTGSIMKWDEGGGSIFYFYEKGKFVDAKWLDNQTLEIRHDKTIDFSPKNETFFFCGDKGVIKYVALHLK